MDSHSIRGLVSPFYSLITLATESGWSDAMAAVRIIGHVRKTERANILHATMREAYRKMCDEMVPIFTLIEEPEGRGLDVIRVELPEREPLLLRLGRFDTAAQRFNRNSTSRTVDFQFQGFLFSDLLDPNGVPSATIGYEIDDDFVEVGLPQWRLGRITLRRERIDSSEFIEEIASFDAPVRFGDLPDPRTAEFFAAQNHRSHEFEELAAQVRLNLAG